MYYFPTVGTQVIVTAGFDSGHVGTVISDDPSKAACFTVDVDNGTRQNFTQSDASFGYIVTNLLSSGERRVFHLSRGGLIAFDSNPAKLQN